MKLTYLRQLQGLKGVHVFNAESHQRHCCGFCRHVFLGAPKPPQPAEDLQHRTFLESHPRAKISAESANARDMLHYSRIHRGQDFMAEDPLLRGLKTKDVTDEE